MDLSRKRDRQLLPDRREPHWQRLEKGAYLGYRKGSDTWLARYRIRDGKQQWEPLGEGLEYDEAKRRAEAWIDQLSGAAVRTVKRGTVQAALEAYLANLIRHGRHEAAHEAMWRFKATVWNPDKGWEDPLAGLALESVTQDDFLEWRDRLVPGRQPRTVNRYVRAVAAGLNKAHQDLGHVGNPAAWTLSRIADDVEDEGETAIFLDTVQRRGVIECASPDASCFLRGLDVTGARPKELAGAKVSDFDGEKIRLLHRKGKPPKLRRRYAMLSNEGIEFFQQQTRGKRPDEPIFTEDGETTWRRHVWSREVRRAIARYNAKQGAQPIPPNASAYSFRHARISELLQVYGIDPLTVAAQTGTSLTVIEKAYFRFIPSAMRAKLTAVKATA